MFSWLLGILILTYLQFCESSPLRATKACNWLMQLLLLLLSRYAPQIYRCVTSIKNGCGGDCHFAVISKNSKLYLTWFIPMQGSPGPVGAPGLPGSTGNPVSCRYSQCSWCFYPTAYLMLVPFWEYSSITWLNRDCFASDVGKWNAVFFSQYVGVTTCGIFPRALWCFDITGTGTIEIVLGRKCL